MRIVGAGDAKQCERYADAEGGVHEPEDGMSSSESAIELRQSAAGLAMDLVPSVEPRQNGEARRARLPVPNHPAKSSVFGTTIRGRNLSGITSNPRTFQ
jgi:hypothetical protein